MATYLILASFLLGLVALLMAVSIPSGWLRLRELRGGSAQDFGLVLLLPEHRAPLLFLLGFFLLLTAGGVATMAIYLRGVMVELGRLPGALKPGAVLPLPNYVELGPVHGALQSLAARLEERQAQLQERQIELERQDELAAHMLVQVAAELGPGLETLREQGVDVQGLQRLLLDLEQAARLPAAELHLRREAVEIRALLQSCIDSLGALKPVNWVLTGPAVVWSADRDRIRQVFLNLLGNALKFSPAGSTVEVTVEARQVGVADRGPGVPRGVEGQPFAAAGEELRRQFGGTGLGLAISRRLVELHGGRLELLPRDGGGSVIRIHWP